MFSSITTKRIEAQAKQAKEVFYKKNGKWVKVTQVYSKKENDWECIHGRS